MTDETIFSDTPTPVPVVEAPAAQLVPEHLREHIGPGKKYASVDKALESIPHAQKHIGTLEAELRDLRTRVESAVSSDEVYKTVQQLLAAEKQTASPSGMDENGITALLDRKLVERDNLARQNENTGIVKKALEKKFGEKAKEAYEARAAELGIGVGFLNDLVKHSPKAALEIFGVKETAHSVVPSSGSVNTDAFAQVKQPQAPSRSVMGGGSSHEVIAAWRAAAST